MKPEELKAIADEGKIEIEMGKNPLGSEYARYKFAIGGLRLDALSMPQYGNGLYAVCALESADEADAERMLRLLRAGADAEEMQKQQAYECGKWIGKHAEAQLDSEMLDTLLDEDGDFVVEYWDRQDGLTVIRQLTTREAIRHYILDVEEAQ